MAIAATGLQKSSFSDSFHFVETSAIENYAMIFDLATIVRHLCCCSAQCVGGRVSVYVNTARRQIAAADSCQIKE
jgi:hypothetical protein